MGRAGIGIMAALLAIELVVVLGDFTCPSRVSRRYHYRLPSHRKLMLGAEEEEEQCMLEFVETIPLGMDYPDGAPMLTTIADSWQKLLNDAEESIDMIVMFWDLRNDTYSNAGKGIYAAFVDAANRGVKIRAVQNKPNAQFPQTDGIQLRESNYADIRDIFIPGLFGDEKSGQLHAKLWLVDGQHLYVGSANMDWRALSHISEKGVVLRWCPTLVADAEKIFETFWKAAGDASLSDPWPIELDTIYNGHNPVELSMNQHAPSPLYVSNAPKEFNAVGREFDLDAILDHINRAKRFVHIAVRDFMPEVIYGEHPENNIYWPDLDAAVRKAAFRGVDIQMLIGRLPPSMDTPLYRERMHEHLCSLLAINPALSKKEPIGGQISISYFNIPDTNPPIPFGRLMHDKYFITDDVAYVGTSNWIGDYFLRTTGMGISFVCVEESKVNDFFTLRDIFQRDFTSTFANPLDCSRPNYRY